ncbi:MAG: alcohol dehydrogenase catalytic domain-containing protein [Sphingomonadales bacterium]|nr:alcohol dehydrogenase catalytic domain-containing protein [Sphingomonadales bacterium]
MSNPQQAKMIAAKKFELRDFEPIWPSDSQVMMSVISCGICSSEIPVFDGSVIGTPGVSFRYRDYPADLGHEVVGTVEAVGSQVSDFEKGDIVTGLTYSGCGFATHFTEEAISLVKVPKSWHKDAKYAVGEPLMATVNIIEQMEPQFGDSVLIVGDGFMSLLLVAALKKYTLKKLIVLGHHDERLALAKKLGASDVLNTKNATEDANGWEFVMDLTGEEGVNISVEYAGNSKSLELAASLTKAKSRSKLVLAAAYDNDMPFTIGNYLQNRAPVIIPAYPNHSKDKVADLRKAMWALDAGIFPMRELITHEYSLDDVALGYQELIDRKPGYIKGIVTI